MESSFQLSAPILRSPLQAASTTVLNTRARTDFRAQQTPSTSAFTTPRARPQARASTTGRKRANENHDVLPVPSTDTQPSKRHKAYAKRRTPEEKLEVVFQALLSVDWSLGAFLYFLFRLKDEKGKDVVRSTRHSMYASHFLQGNTTYTPGVIIEFWFLSSDGANNNIPMYALEPPYATIKPAQASLTAFAAQVVEKKLVKEARTAVKPASGLHATSKRRGTHKVEWQDVGASTASLVEDLVKLHQPLTWQLLNRVAGRQKGDVRAVKKRRPTETVCTHVIASLNFTRNNEARLLPLARGLLYFAYSAPADLMAYGSRIGEMPAYSTVYNTLKGLANHESTVTRAHATDPTKCGFLVFDNVQNYTRQRDHRVGRTNKMNIGIAATYCELEGASLVSGGVEDRRARVLENKRANLTVEQLLTMINSEHLETVFSIHWLRVLVNSVPQLEQWKEHITMLFTSKAAILQLPIQATKVHPLASSGKNETVTTELKDALVDFFAQMGQTEAGYNDRILFAGGDGLTFQKMLELQRYLQFHPNPFQSLELLEPVLAMWHTELTDLSRIYETHWDGPLSQDPSTIGHSAAQINRAGPTNLKKVDYYPAADLMYLVLDVRMLDCWRLYFKCDNIFDHFDKLAEKKGLPDIEDLISASRTLHQVYSSTRAIYLALGDPMASSEWTDIVPLGSPWSAPRVFGSSQPAPQPEASDSDPAKKKRTKKPPPPPFRHPNGDRVLANSVTFMRDALTSREMSYAIAQGDVGRVYQVLKVLLFTFTGSSHTKYSTYLLETISRLELESSKDLRETILRTTLVNLTGRVGAFSAADIMQEYFNRLLEAIVEKKGIEYGDTFIRQVISRNLHHFARIKLDLRVGVGLTQRSGRHSVPHLNPEIRILLETYKTTELHSRRPGRVYRELDKDNFQLGITKLREGKLKKFVQNTTQNRGLLQSLEARSQEAAGDEDSDEEDSDDEDGAGIEQSLAFGQIVNGEYLLGAVEDLGADIDNLLAELDSHFSGGKTAEHGESDSASGEESGLDMDVD